MLTKSSDLATAAQARRGNARRVATAGRSPGAGRECAVGSLDGPAPVVPLWGLAHVGGVGVVDRVGAVRRIRVLGRLGGEPDVRRVDPVDRFRGVDAVDRLGRIDPVDRLRGIDPVDRFRRVDADDRRRQRRPRRGRVRRSGACPAGRPRLCGGRPAQRHRRWWRLRPGAGPEAAQPTSTTSTLSSAPVGARNVTASPGAEPSSASPRGEDGLITSRSSWRSSMEPTR